MKRKTVKAQKRQRAEIEREQAEVGSLCPFVLRYIQDGMEINWRLIKAQRPQWSQAKCEEYFGKVRSYIIRNHMRSGI